MMRRVKRTVGQCVVRRVRAVVRRDWEWGESPLGLRMPIVTVVVVVVAVMVVVVNAMSSREGVEP
jgi:hypothetical protein